VDGRVTYDWGKSQNNVFENNVFFGNHVELPIDAHTIKNQPALLKPGSGGNGFDSLSGYKLRDASACRLGKIISDNGGRDFFGNSVPADRPPCIGAAQSNQ
jgi:hypothetical protein